MLKKREDNLARDFKKRRKHMIYISNPNAKEWHTSLRQEGHSGWQ